MSFPPQSDEVHDGTQLEESLAGSLPMELVMSILETATVQHRKANLCWSLALSLVCSIARASVLPIVYETVFLDIKSKRKGKFMGWDNHSYKHLQLAFLCWIVNDPSAPPRRHIKHLIFRHDGEFLDEDLEWLGPREGSEPAEWPLELLTVRFPPDLTCLYRAGLRPRTALKVGKKLNIMDELPSDLFERTARRALRDINSCRLHAQTWAGIPNEMAGDGRAITRAKQTSLTCRELDPRTADYVSVDESTAAPQHTGVKLLTVQLVDEDYLQQFPDLLLASLAALLNSDSEMRIILACSVDHKVAGQPVAEFIRAAVPSTLPQDALTGRIRISHAGATPMLAGDDVFYALAEAMRCGRDPWDEGQEV